MIVGDLRRESGEEIEEEVEEATAGYQQAPAFRISLYIELRELNSNILV